MARSNTDADAAVSVYATFPDMQSADSIGTAIVEAGLAACANIIPGMRSIYRWQGKIERSEEVVAFIKTTAARVDEVIAAIEARHPYDTPAVVVLPIDKGSRRYLDWIARETAGGR
jgi:periplasmic divalent cation tolerance protein